MPCGEFRGLWHIPGGYNRWPEADVQETCSRIAKREIRMNVEYQSPPIDEYKWKTGEHVYGHPLSLYCRCVPAGDIWESDTLHFVRLADDLPGIVIGPHARFIHKYIQRLNGWDPSSIIVTRDHFRRSINWKLGDPIR